MQKNSCIRETEPVTDSSQIPNQIKNQINTNYPAYGDNTSLY